MQSEVAFVVTDLVLGEEAEWDEYVRAHPDGSIYHLSAWRSIIEGAFGHDVVLRRPGPGQDQGRAARHGWTAGSSGGTPCRCRTSTGAAFAPPTMEPNARCEPSSVVSPTAGVRSGTNSATRGRETHRPDSTASTRRSTSRLTRIKCGGACPRPPGTRFARHNATPGRSRGVFDRRRRPLLPGLRRLHAQPRHAGVHAPVLRIGAGAARPPRTSPSSSSMGRPWPAASPSPTAGTGSSTGRVTAGRAAPMPKHAPVLGGPGTSGPRRHRSLSFGRSLRVRVRIGSSASGPVSSDPCTGSTCPGSKAVRPSIRVTRDTGSLRGLAPLPLPVASTVGPVLARHLHEGRPAQPPAARAGPSGRRDPSPRAGVRSPPITT